MEKKYKITDEDFRKLKNGAIKYFVKYCKLSVNPVL